MNVYGGPGSQTVTDSWSGPNYLWHQMLAQDGYLVASVDNRGTGGGGAEVIKLTYPPPRRHQSGGQLAPARRVAPPSYVGPPPSGILGGGYGRPPGAPRPLVP